VKDLVEQYFKKIKKSCGACGKKVDREKIKYFESDYLKVALCSRCIEKVESTLRNKYL